MATVFLRADRNCREAAAWKWPERRKVRELYFLCKPQNLRNLLIYGRWDFGRVKLPSHLPSYLPRSAAATATVHSRRPEAWRGSRSPSHPFPVSPVAGGVSGDGIPSEQWSAAHAHAYRCRTGPPRSRVCDGAAGRRQERGQRCGQGGHPAAGAGGHGRRPGRLRGRGAAGLLLPLPRGAAGGAGGTQGLLGAGAVRPPAGGPGGERGMSAGVRSRRGALRGSCKMGRLWLADKTSSLAHCCEWRKPHGPTSQAEGGKGWWYSPVLFIYFPQFLFF